METDMLDNYQKFLKRKALNFKKIEDSLHNFAKKIQKEKEILINILTTYETYEVADDEIKRSLDLLLNIHENKKYFKKEIGPSVSFLPRNQPLYALCCFAIIPSTMSQKMTTRPPGITKKLYEELDQVLNFQKTFPNLQISYAERNEFLKTHTQTYLDKTTNTEQAITEFVIFTGSNQSSIEIRKKFHKNTLIITNGSGHNPIVIAKDADIDSAIKSCIKVGLYNQGQDCASPSSILVNKEIIEKFLKKFTAKVLNMEVGDTKEFKNKIGPITKIKDLERIQNLLIENSQYLSPKTPGIIKTKEKIVYPSIIIKPLKDGGNYTEQFAPVFFIQEYEEDKDLALYFENQKYALNAMYITIFGKSKYINSLKKKKFGKKILHPASSIIENTNLHAPGIERGVCPYGGYGSGASSLYYQGKLTAKPTLPQRDIYETLIKPFENFKPSLYKITQKIQISIPKKSKKIQEKPSPKKIPAIQTQEIKLLNKKNKAYFKTLSPEEKKSIKQLKETLKNLKEITPEILKTEIFKIATPEIRKEFFTNVYMLLLNETKGPRLSSLITNKNKSHIIKMLSFIDLSFSNYSAIKSFNRL